MDEATQVIGTQDIYDPRRMGRNNSGLQDSDIPDVLCILHPASPAAYRIVAFTAQRAPQHILQNDSFSAQNGDEQFSAEEAETFIVGQPHAMDLALRFSSRILRTEYGFVFGRSPAHCDIPFDQDSSKRISNMHFRIFVNNQGVMMIEDWSTNGTVVDEQVLSGRPDHRKKNLPNMRMLAPGSIIQIVSPDPDEIIKFIVRIPSREGHQRQWNHNFEHFVRLYEETRLAAEMRGENLDWPPGRIMFPRAKATPVNSAPKAPPPPPPPPPSYPMGTRWTGGEKYSILGQVGRGAFATVYQVATKADGQLYAAKELDKRKCAKNGVLDVKVSNEMNIMRSIQHPHIVQYIEYIDHETHMYIIMEYVTGGDLQQWLINDGPLPEGMACRMAHQVLGALDYLHRKKITHRDIKPDNILIADTRPESFTIKLSDFGLSKVVAEDNQTFLKTFCGTLLYCAPEVFPHYETVMNTNDKKRPFPTGPPQIRQRFYGQSVDIWSFAAVLWFSLCMKPPYEGVADATGKGMYDKIMSTQLDARWLLAAGASAEPIDLLFAMLQKNPKERPSPAQCLQHRWFHAFGTPPPPPAEVGLGAIAEEPETDGSNFANLSLAEPPSNGTQLSLGSSAADFFDPRKSKRFKSSVAEYDGEPLESSPEAVFDHIPIANQTSKPVKLFGEISRSALQTHGDLSSNERTESLNSEEEGLALQNSVLASGSAFAQQRAHASPSLLGTESLVRDMNMTSPNGSHHAAKSATPALAKSSQNLSVTEITPKPATPKFNRQISIPFPPSLYWESADPSTHNNEYASKVSGHDFNANPSITFPVNARNSGSTADKDEAGSAEEEDSLDAIAPPSSSGPLLAKLISTADSFAHITLVLTKRREDWGRAPSNTKVYEYPLDTRIPKRAIIIWFFASDIDKYPEGDDGWVNLPDLQACVMTEKRGGILVNGVNLPKNEPDCHAFGRIYTGDEIEVYSRDGECMKFICEFFHGLGRESRPQNVPPFVVETLRNRDASPVKSKGKEKVTSTSSRGSG